MKHGMHNLTKQIAWNGITAMIPGDWEIDGIEADYLLVGKDADRKMELKWTLNPGRRSLAQQVKRFVDKSRKQLGIAIHEQPTPKHFIPDTSGFDFFFFTWKDQAGNGNGVLLHCRICNRLTIVRFFERFSWENMPLMSAIVQSLTDHAQGATTRWEIFGMAFSTPSPLSLKKFTLKPGNYHISLSGKKTKLSLFSWGPASFLLSTITLQDFAKERIKLPEGGHKVSTGYDRSLTGIEWAFKTPLYPNVPLPKLLNFFPAFTICRITHHERKNRIFGILASGTKAGVCRLIEQVSIDR